MSVSARSEAVLRVRTLSQECVTLLDSALHVTQHELAHASKVMRGGQPKMRLVAEASPHRAMPRNRAWRGSALAQGRVLFACGFYALSGRERSFGCCASAQSPLDS